MSAKEQPGRTDETTITVEAEPSLVLKMLGVLGCLLPPRMHENGHKDIAEKAQQYERRVRRWRYRISYTVIFLLFAVGAEVALSWGLKPQIFAGFEHKTEAQVVAEQTSQRTTRIETRLLEQSLLNVRQGQCRTTDKTYFTQRLNELLEEYKRLTGQDWRLPGCEELEQ